MEKEVITEEEIAEDQLNAHAKENILMFLLRLGLIVFLVLLMGVAIYLLLRVDDKPSQKQNKISTVSNQPSKPPQVRNQYETDKTQLATSLEVPPLYSKTEWMEVKKGASTEGLNEVWIYEEGIKIPLKGRYWISKSSLESYKVETYYWDALSELGWVAPGGGSADLEFNSFALSGISADASCVGAVGSLGYKDGFVRLVTIKYGTTFCHSLGQPDVTHNPINPELYSDYTIFISDPMPIEEIAKYIRPSSASRS